MKTPDTGVEDVLDRLDGCVVMERDVDLQYAILDHKKAEPIIRTLLSSHTTYWKERVRKEKLGWEGYVVVDPQSNNYKCSPIFFSVKEAEKWRRDFGESALKVATVDVILKN